MPKVKIGDETHEVDVSAIQLDENQLIIDRENPPSGLFTQKALDEKVKDISRKKIEKAKQELADDEDFHKQVLSRFNISLDDRGKPTGLKPDFDPDEWKRSQAKELTRPLQQQVETLQTKYERAKRARIEDKILAATKGVYDERFTKPGDNGKVRPIVVNQFRDMFDEDDNGEIRLREGDGFAVDSNGDPITPDKYLTDADKFGDWMIDRRQKSSGFQGGTPSGGRRFTREQLAKMSDAEYAKNREAIQQAQTEGLIG
jgi:hypothetical protein